MISVPAAEQIKLRESGNNSPWTMFEHKAQAEVAEFLIDFGVPNAVDELMVLRPSKYMKGILATNEEPHSTPKSGAPTTTAFPSSSPAPSSVASTVSPAGAVGPRSFAQVAKEFLKQATILQMQLQQPSSSEYKPPQPPQ